MGGRAHRFAASTLLVAAAYAGAVGATAPPAAAAPCSSADGVTVVVDFHGLGGGLQQVCDADGGGQKASTLFTSNGFDLAYVQRQPGFVCRVEAKPADDPCVNTPPADAYWGLWWSDGTSGQWTYSSLGVASLEIPEGGSVAFSWNSGSGQDKPGAAPPKHVMASETPSPSPSTDGGGGGGNGGGNGGNGGGSGGGSGAGADASPTPGTNAPASESAEASPAPEPTKSDKPAKSDKPDESDEPTESEAESTEPSTTDSGQVEDLEGAEPTASPPAADESGLPVWLAPVVVVVLFGAATAVAVVRRRRRPAGPPEP